MTNSDDQTATLMGNSSSPQESSKSRTLVLCFDGTSNEYDADNTNVVKLFALLKKDEIDSQMCLYQPGIGTYFEPGVVSPLLLWAAKYIDIAFATFLDAHVIEGYKYLMQHYRKGDKICIFGFSRGAYIARAVAGFLYKVGLLPRDNQAQVHFAYKMYKRTDSKGLRLCAGFKQTYCQHVDIEFMGLWDTVASVGVMMGRTLPFTNANRSIKTVRHALSLDEHRAKFRPNHYYKYRCVPQDSRVNTKDYLKQTGRHSSPETPRRTRDSSRKRTSVAKRVTSEDNTITKTKTGKAIAPELVEKNSSHDTDVLEVWFAGCHGDVGGGAVPNDTETTLANISLRWMVHEIIASDCGIQFDQDALKRIDIDIGPEASVQEIDFDKEDALRCKHSAFKKRPLWWLLEILPLHYSYQAPDGEWHRELSINLGKGRKIREEQPIFHASVKTRMLHEKYTPKARWKEGSEVYVQ
ncbi:hypothetical protein CPB83DRAFT_859308 [Crepidotus variabilis]|uniref:T6SS Phospholipase effector Tle1-like catalytic domain-containing protein n=1 Tax=Crepidotus variabilis TaxID=179855 RepID=A0A9P6E9Y1_9AGAR|nr:hypothetical protein CPB83DRAFT_859308 [Crepidotus variabilis]